MKHKEDKKKNPNLFLIGGMRCGSTALHQILNGHDEIFMSKDKEPYFFKHELMRRTAEKEQNRELINAFKKIQEKRKFTTYDKYLSLFDEAENQKYIGESSHYIYHPKTAKIIKEKNPNAKIIISVRNPIDRFYSEYNLLINRQNKLNKPIKMSFEDFFYQELEYLKQKKKSRLNKGMLSHRILKWQEVFGEENVRILNYDDLKMKPSIMLNALFDWLGIENVDYKKIKKKPQRSGKIILKPLFLFINNNKILNKLIHKLFSLHSRAKMREIFYLLFIRKKEMAMDVRAKLLEVYMEEINSLEQIFNKNLNNWKK